MCKINWHASHHVSFCPVFAYACYFFTYSISIHSPILVNTNQLPTSFLFMQSKPLLRRNHIHFPLSLFVLLNMLSSSSLRYGISFAMIFSDRICPKTHQTPSTAVTMLWETNNTKQLQAPPKGMAVWRLVDDDVDEPAQALLWDPHPCSTPTSALRSWPRCRYCMGGGIKKPTSLCNQWYDVLEYL